MSGRDTTFLNTIKHCEDSKIAIVGDFAGIEHAIKTLEKSNIALTHPLSIFKVSQEEIKSSPLNTKVYDYKKIDLIDFDLLIIVDLELPKARSRHFSLSYLQEKDIPVVFGFTRGLYFKPLGFNSTGISLPGIFKLISMYIKTIKKTGDYAEFGVFDGHSFSIAYQALKNTSNIKNFLAFDSFEGIKNTKEEELKNFKDGQFYASLKTFTLNLEVINMDFNRLKTIKGDFNKSLNEENSKRNNIKDVLVAHIDCDVYEPAKKALDYLTHKITDGGIILFDDFDQMGASNKKGERLALKEWLEENKNIKVELYRTYAIFGRAFIVHKETP